jgi:hypothetical protein
MSYLDVPPNIDTDPLFAVIYRAVHASAADEPDVSDDPVAVHVVFSDGAIKLVDPGDDDDDDSAGDADVFLP